MPHFKIDYQDTPYLTTGRVGTYPNRLNWRCELLLSRNKAVIENKRILDIACHDGRFSYACLKLGAKHVTGVEGRTDLVASAKSNLRTLGYSSDRYEFICDDIFNKIREFQSHDFDVILCFGFFYHTIRQIELLQEIKRIKPDHFILDTTVYAESFYIKATRKLRIMNHLLNMLPGGWRLKIPPHPDEYIVFRKEDHKKPSNTIERFDVVCKPSAAAVELLLQIHGFNYTQIMWENENISDWKDIDDYINKTRVSYISSL